TDLAVETAGGASYRASVTLNRCLRGGLLIVARRGLRKNGETRAVSPVAVSVIVPCHNAAEFLADALESVRDQTLRDLECIIVDDSSSDGIAGIARPFVKAQP